jgi:predicted deacylase
VSAEPSETTQPVDLLPIDITTYTGNTAIQYIMTFDSEKPGPHLLVNALTQGNEVCGAHALDYLFRNEVTPVRGKLSLCFASIDAYETFDVANPAASRCLDEDYNQLWAAEVLEAPTRSREHERAKLLRPLFDEIDHMLDLHSMQTPSPVLALAGTTEKCLATSMAIRVPAHIVVDAGLKVIAQAGTKIARDGTRPVFTAYDDCVLIMPTRRIKRGQPAVRFGRYRP